MSTRMMASDEVTDGIAAIEVHRQGTEREEGLAVACAEALRKLQNLLEQEKSALQQNTLDVVLAANVEVVANEIRRVQSMSGAKGQGPASRNARPRDPQALRQDGKAHNPPRNRGRRTMGRAGGRGGRGGGSGGGHNGR